MLTSCRPILGKGLYFLYNTLAFEIAASLPIDQQHYHYYFIQTATTFNFEFNSYTANPTILPEIVPNIMCGHELKKSNYDPYTQFVEMIA